VSTLADYMVEQMALAEEKAEAEAEADRLKALAAVAEGRDPHHGVTAAQMQAAVMNIDDWVEDLLCGHMTPARRSVTKELCKIVAVLAGGTLFFHLLPGENKTLVDAFYMAVVSCSSVGYGDVHPNTRDGKIFAVVWLLSGTMIVARAFGTFANLYIKMKTDEVNNKLLSRAMSANELEEADIDGGGDVSEAEFIVHKLRQMKMVDEAEVRKISKRYFALVGDGGGDVQPGTPRGRRPSSAQRRPSLSKGSSGARFVTERTL
jgi:hypothetical protein